MTTTENPKNSRLNGGSTYAWVVLLCQKVKCSCYRVRLYGFLERDIDGHCWKVGDIKKDLSRAGGFELIHEMMALELHKIVRSIPSCYLTFFSTLYPSNPQVYLVLFSKYIQKQPVPYHFHCEHFGPSCFHLSPGPLQWLFHWVRSYSCPQDCLHQITQVY